MKYVFVAGCGHTGTTLVATILGSHPKIHTIPHETGTFLKAYAKVDIIESFARRAKQIGESYQYMCEKTPRHVHRLATIFECLPEARVILMIRDGRDVVASLKSRTKQFMPSLERWLDDTRASLSWKHDSRVLVVKYETLVAHPGDTIEQMCSHLGLSYDPAMLHYHEKADNWFNETSVQAPETKAPDEDPEAVHRVRRNWQVHQPLYNGSGRWHNELSGEELLTFNRRAAGLMEEIGYYDPAVGDLNNPYSSVPIEVSGTPEETNFATWGDKLNNKPSAPATPEDTYDAMLREQHHRAYGRPWSLGRYYFEFLVSHGVQPGDRFLDFGCGAGRLGIWLIRYLQPGRYFGIEAHLGSLRAFAEYEMPMHGLAYKLPRLLHNSTCDLGHFQAKFAAIADLHVSHHLPPAVVKRFYGIFCQSLEPGGRIFVPHPPKLSKEELGELGLGVQQVVHSKVPLLQESLQNIKKVDDWHILVRSRESEPG